MRRAILTALFVLTATIASAQTPPVSNPTQVVFDHADYASADHYEGGYFLYPVVSSECDWTGTVAAAPVQVDNLGKPTSVTGLNMSASLMARPKGCYVYRVRVLDVSGLWSDWSDPSPFAYRRPVAPGKPALK